MTNSNYLKLQAPNSFDTKKLEFGASSMPMSKQEKREKRDRSAGTAVRLRAIRKVSPYPTPQAFCKFLGIGTSRLSMVENGSPIGRGLQDIIIAKLPWVSRSYLMDNCEDALTGFWRQRLALAVAEESDTTRPRTRSPSSGGSGRRSAKKSMTS
jgi:hypothetical protein